MAQLHRCTHTARAGPRAVFRILPLRQRAQVFFVRGFSVSSCLFIQDRLLDKTHRSLVHSLQREVSRYGGSLTLDPTIRHFLIQYQKLGEHKLDEVKIPLKKPIITKQNSNDILESVLHYILCCTVPVGHQQKQVYSEHNETRKLNLLYIMNELKTSRDALDSDRIEEDVQLVMSRIEVAESKKTHELVRLSVETFHMLMLTGGLNHTVEADLIPWLRSIRSSGVKDACMALNNIVEIPAFVLTDILLRTPMTRYELYLQLDLWYNFQDTIAKALYNRQRHLREVISNLVFYTTQYDVHKLPEFLQRLIDFFTSRHTGFTFKLITPTFINQYVWQIPFDFISAPKTHSAPMSSIIRAQEVLVKALGQQKLSLSGHMGIALIISYMSKEKSTQLFRLAQAKFLDSDPEPQELLSYHFVKILLTNSPDQLLQAFNEAMVWNEKSSSVWLAFVKKLNDLELLNSKRAVQIAERLVDHSDNVIISKNILLHLLLPVNSISVLQQFTGQLARVPALLRANKAILMSKYMSILYKNLDEQSPVISELQEAERPPETATALSIARNIYSNSIGKKTSRIVGTMLNGEVQVQPQRIYDVYKKELSDNNLSPDETCLIALMRGALVRADVHNECFVWDNMYAPQIAIVEFKKNVIRHRFSGTLDAQLDEDFDRIYPSDELWRAYVALLHQYRYISELSEIIKWWEDIDFVPHSRTLTMLLKALPADFAQRYIKHAETVKTAGSGPTKWPWPSVDDIA